MSGSTRDLFPHLDRRRFLRGLALGGGAAAVAGAGVLGVTTGSSGSGGAPGAATDPTRLSAASPAITASSLAGRTLVVIELEGGNDGLDTLVPINDGRYVDFRDTVGVDRSTLLRVDDDAGLNPVLAGLHAGGFAAVEGVGLPAPDLSHFESSRRWWQGDMTGTATDDTGVLGRLCDALAGEEPVTGVAVGAAASPMLRSRHAVTLGINDLHGGGWLGSEDAYAQAVRAGLDTMIGGNAGGNGLETLARANAGRALDFVDVLADLPDRETDLYPGGDLSDRLRTCAQLLSSEVGVRVLHVPWGSFDTHDDHRGNHDEQLRMLDAALSAFRTDLADLGLDDSTLIATTSEFGRRPEANAGGTDHGTASCMLLAGPVVAGRHGEAASLADLDDDGNLRARVTMAEYYATLCEEWFGVPAGEVLLEDASPIGGIVA